jgi:hypothetical protein
MTRTSLTFATLGAALTFATPALATVIVETHPYQDPAPQAQIHNTGSQTATLVTGFLKPSTPELLYDFVASPQETLQSNGQGHAKIEALDGGMFSLTMTPETAAGDFTAIDFNVNVPNGRTARDVAKVGPIASFISFTLVLADNSVVNTAAYALGGNNMFLVFGNDNEVFKSITWNGWTSAAMVTAAQFEDIRQIDLKPGQPSVTPTGPIPEPATWSLMILGFGAVGSALRRRQKLGVRFAF